MNDTKNSHTTGPTPPTEELEDAKAMVLLSGGLDSATALYWVLATVSDPENTIAVSYLYGQRHGKEVQHAMAVAAAAGVQHTVLRGLDFPKSMLTDPAQEVPDVSYDELEGISPTYVPFRNGTMLSRAAAEAQARGYHYIVMASHAEDAQGWAYPDCSPEFNGAMANAIFIGTYMEVRLLTPFQFMTKAEIVGMGKKLDVPFEKTWSCYKGVQLHCGKCPTCRARRQAFRRAGVQDRTLYMEEVR